MLFATANLAYWLFFGIGVALFVLAIVGGGSDRDLDLDAELDLDLDPELDLEADGDLDPDSDGEFGLAFLSRLGFGKAPLILLLAIDFSCWGLIGLIFNLAIASATGQIPINLFGLGGLVFVSSLVTSLAIGSLLARPLGKMFASFGEDTSSDRLIGCQGIVSSKQVPYENNNAIAQADVLDSAKNLVTVAICLPEWAEQIPLNGDEILVIENQEAYYLAIQSQGADREKWLNSLKQ